MLVDNNNVTAPVDSVTDNNVVALHCGISVSDLMMYAQRYKVHAMYTTCVHAGACSVIVISAVSSIG